MFFDPIDIPDALLDAQEQGELVIFAGAGVSMGEPSELPSFEGLARNIAGSHPRGAGLAKRKLANDRLDLIMGDLARDGVKVEQRCREIIDKPKSRPTELHSSLVGLFRGCHPSGMRSGT
jgi:hypothetical protein